MDAPTPTTPVTAPVELFVAGRWVPASDGRRFTVENPATEATITQVADAGPQDALLALDAAARAQDEWVATPARTRAELLRAAFELLTERADELATTITLEMGKPLAESRAEVAYAAEFFRWFSEEASRVAGRVQDLPDGSARMLVTRAPVGPCLFVTPWNFPIAMGARKLGPALAAGCTTVVKPASETPLTMLALAAVLEEAGVPAGVVNVVPTSSAGPMVGALLADPRLRKLSFTGSTETGRLLMRAAAQHVVRLSLELGGNAPFLVFEDADLEAAVDGAVIAKMRNTGQACTAANRFHVARSVAAEFAERLGARLAAMRIGSGLEPGVEVGPLINRAAKEGVSALVAEAVDLGATVVTGGEAPAGPGYFFTPTVLLDVPAKARLLHEEVFGPVAPVTAFDDEDHAVELANATEYGLVAYVYSGDESRALRVAERLDTGMVGVNRGLVSNAAAPFGGVKESGFGREGGVEGIHEYLDVKYVALPR